MPERTFTLQEANQLLPRVEECLRTVKATLDRLREVRDQLTDLRIVWGEKLADAACPDHAEYEAYRAEFSGLEADLGRMLAKLRELGCEVKDPDAGLVDFVARRAGETVYLCWRRGEPSIQYWHGLEAGFAGRKTIQSF